MNHSLLRWLALLLTCLGAALAGFGGWALIRGEVFEAVARVRLIPDREDFPRFPGKRGFGYYPSNQIALIKSDNVLNRAVETLQLQEHSGAGANWRTVPKSCRSLRKRISISPAHNAQYLDIHARDSSPERAVIIANAVAKAYSEQSQVYEAAVKSNALKVLEARFNEGEAEAKRIADNANRLRNELCASDQEAAGWSNRLQTGAISDNRVRDLRPFDEAMQKLEQTLQFQRILRARLSMGLSGFDDPGARILETPQHPDGAIFPNRSCSQNFLLSGIAIAGIGGLLLKRRACSPASYKDRCKM
jgi:uncharacterized protein involved in exopolysaccharide biosynthesis